MSQFFLSYSREELTFSDSLYHELRNHNVDVWMDIYRLQPGNPWKDQIMAAVREAETFLFIVSKESLNSANAREELMVAQQMGKRIILIIFQAVPLRHDDHYSLPHHPVDWAALTQCEFVDFRSSFKKALASLVRTIDQPERHTGKVVPQNGINLPTTPRYYVLLSAGRILFEVLFVWFYLIGAFLGERGSDSVQLIFVGGCGVPLFINILIRLRGIWQFMTRKYRMRGIIHNLNFNVLILIALLASPLFGYNTIYRLQIFLGCSLFLTIIEMTLFGSTGMYRWAGKSGIVVHQQARSWKRLFLLPMLGILGILFAVGFGFYLISSNTIDTSSGSAFENSVNRYTQSTLGLQLTVDDIQYLFVVGLGISGTLLGLSIIEAFSGLLIGRATRRYRRVIQLDEKFSRPEEGGIATKPIKIAIDFAEQDRAMALRIRPLVAQYHQYVSSQEADIVVCLLSRFKPSFKKHHFNQIVYPFLIDGNFSDLDDDVEVLEIIDWRSGIPQNVIKQVAQALPYPEQMALILNRFPARTATPRQSRIAARPLMLNRYLRFSWIIIIVGVLAGIVGILAKEDSSENISLKLDALLAQEGAAVLTILIFLAGSLLVRRRLLRRQRGPVALMGIMSLSLVGIYLVTQNLGMLAPIIGSILLTVWLLVSDPIKAWLPSMPVNTANRNLIFNQALEHQIRRIYGIGMLSILLLDGAAIAISLLYAHPIPDTRENRNPAVSISWNRLGKARHNPRANDQPLWCYKRTITFSNGESRQEEGFAIFNEANNIYQFSPAAISPETGEFLGDYPEVRKAADCDLRPVRTTNFLAIHTMGIVFILIGAGLVFKTWQNIAQQRVWIFRTLGILILVVIIVGVYTRGIWFIVPTIIALGLSIYLYVSESKRLWIQGL